MQTNDFFFVRIKFFSFKQTHNYLIGTCPNPGTGQLQTRYSGLQ